MSLTNTSRHSLAAAVLAGIVTVADGTALCAREPAPAQGSEQEEAARKERAKQLAALKKKMSGRYATLKAMRDAGKVGEAHTGLVALVKAAYGKAKVDPRKKDSPTLAQLVAAENADRTALYRLLAAQLGTKPAVIARQNAVRRFKKAEPRHYLLLQSGKWATRKQLDEAIEAQKKKRAGN